MNEGETKLVCEHVDCDVVQSKKILGKFQHAPSPIFTGDHWTLIVLPQRTDKKKGPEGPSIGFR